MYPKPEPGDERQFMWHNNDVNSNKQLLKLVKYETEVVLNCKPC